jgi:hypothetical protein
LIVEHYRGTPEVARRAAEAEAALEKLHYMNENAVSFEEYVSRMTEQFELLEDNDQGLSETQKVTQFLEGILSTHPDVRSIISQVRSQFLANFYEASKHFAGQLSLIPGYMVKVGQEADVEIMQSVVSRHLMLSVNMMNTWHGSERIISISVLELVAHVDAVEIEDNTTVNTDLGSMSRIRIEHFPLTNMRDCVRVDTLHGWQM